MRYTILQSMRRVTGALSCAILLTMAGAPGVVSAASPSPAVREAQTILTKVSIPVGAIDGYHGQQTARGLCVFRQITALGINRNNVDSAVLVMLRDYNGRYSNLNAIPAPSLGGKSMYLLVHQTCQTMTYVDNGRFVKVMPVSTGITGHKTPNGTYQLGYTQRGWSCSTIYPESCRTQNSGRFASVS